MTPPKPVETNEGEDTFGDGPYDPEEESGEEMQMEALDITCE